jgi:hypothetical protein
MTTYAPTDLDNPCHRADTCTMTAECALYPGCRRVVDDITDAVRTDPGRWRDRAMVAETRLAQVRLAATHSAEVAEAAAVEIGALGDDLADAIAAIFGHIAGAMRALATIPGREPTR